jgi:glycosyltransferase involved in cell wall biosynthesis
MNGRRQMVIGGHCVNEMAEPTQERRPVVSIIVVSHNRAADLRETLASIAACAIPAGLPTEIIVVDNASTDDTPAVLAEFGNRFGADTNRWLLLTGDKGVLYELIANSFLPRNPDDPYNFMPGGFNHTERIAVVDNHGHLRAFFDGLKSETSQAVAEEINQLRDTAGSL